MTSDLPCMHSIRNCAQNPPTVRWARHYVSASPHASSAPAALFNSCRLRSSCGQLASSAGQLWLAVVNSPAASVNSGQLWPSHQPLWSTSVNLAARAPLSPHARPDSRLKSGKRTRVTQTNSDQLRPKLDPARQSPPSPRRGQKGLLRSICKPMLRCRHSRRPSFLNGHRATRRG